MKKILISSIFALVLFFSFSFSVSLVHAQCTTNADNGTTKYCLLAPIPGLTSSTDGSIDVTTGFGDYVNRMVRVFIGLLGVLAVIMIVFGGIQYMLSSSGGEKNAGKERMTNAIFGLVLALSSYMILNTINPNLVKLKISIPSGSLNINNFDPNQTGQDGLGVGGPALVGVGNKVKDSSTGDEITAGDTKNNTTEYVGTSAFGGGLDYSDTSGGNCDDSFGEPTPYSDPTSCVFANNGKGMPDIIINKAIDASLKQVFADWRTKKNVNYDKKHPYQISSITGFDSALAPGANVLQSAHAFGIAVDIGPTPIDPDLIAIFKSHGFGWGGDLSTPDIKHFSKLQEEQGSGSDSYARE